MAVGYPSGTTSMPDMPASYHNGAGGFSFADGHSEVHRWRDGFTKQPVRSEWPSATQVARRRCPTCRRVITMALADFRSPTAIRKSIAGETASRNSRSDLNGRRLPKWHDVDARHAGELSQWRWRIFVRRRPFGSPSLERRLHETAGQI